MRVLITGAGGFIGSQVARQVVKDGHSVWAVLRAGASAERLTDCLDRLSLVRLDLRDGGEVRRVVLEVRPDCAIHLAWYAVPGRYLTATENLECASMSLFLAQALAEAGCKRLVAAGSCAEYDWDYGFLSEASTPLRPRSLYGVCKSSTQEILCAYCEQTPIKFAWTRFFYLYGPGEPQVRLVPSVTLALLSGEVANCSSGEQIRDYLHVEDAGSAVWAVARSSLSGPVNIGSGEPVRVRTLLETLGRILRLGHRIAFGALQAPAGEPPLLVADVRKLKTGTDWSPAWGLEDGLRQTVSWWRRRKSG